MAEESTPTQQIELTTDLPADLLMLIGRVTVVFGQLEYVLQLCTKRLSDLDFDTAMSDAEKLKNVHALKNRVDELFQIRSMDQGKEAEFGALIDQIEPLYRRRADVIHGLFAVEQHGRAIHQWKRDAKFAELADLANLHRDARDVMLTLNSITHPKNQ
ncbi:MAG: hypothetical protein O7A62_09110 [Alphaproteobacteria bacterium]|nr:hypothetical protein [Alphaproteobacteria bacterium]